MSLSLSRHACGVNSRGSSGPKNGLCWTLKIKDFRGSSGPIKVCVGHWRSQTRTLTFNGSCFWSEEARSNAVDADCNFDTWLKTIKVSRFWTICISTFSQWERRDGGKLQSQRFRQNSSLHWIKLRKNINRAHEYYMRQGGLDQWTGVNILPQIGMIMDQK